MNPGGATLVVERLFSQDGLILKQGRPEGVTHTLFCQKPTKAVGSTPKPLQGTARHGNGLQHRSGKVWGHSACHPPVPPLLARHRLRRVC